jgi:hypothetical protein
MTAYNLPGGAVAQGRHLFRSLARSIIASKDSPSHEELGKLRLPGVALTTRFPVHAASAVWQRQARASDVVLSDNSPSARQLSSPPIAIPPGAMRGIFFVSLFRQMLVVRPIVSGVLLAMVGLGLVIGDWEGWQFGDSLHFTVVTGLTIDNGDLAPHHALSRIIAVFISLAGIVLTGMAVALIMQALRAMAVMSMAKAACYDPGGLEP